VDTLFETDPAPRLDREALRDRLSLFASRGVRIGGSSWKYPGWLDQIYTRSRYLSRGRFSKKLFEETCLREYATIFPTVCGDFSFYQFPDDVVWRRIFGQIPTGFKFGLKVPEQITVCDYPIHPRYGALAGLENPSFLDVNLLDQSWLRALEPYRQQVGVLIFEFGTFRRKSFESASDFVKALDPFLARLPAGWRYAVEIRNAEFITPEYFECLRAHNLPHVYSSWTRMPDMAEQIAIPEAQTSDLIVARALLRRGRPYEQAVQMFSPYTHVQDVNESVRGALRELIDIAIVDGRPAFIFINNRLEGNSPGTIISITE
jgi:uncharacterized protein YecE (DUF72 family)